MSLKGNSHTENREAYIKHKIEKIIIEKIGARFQKVKLLQKRKYEDKLIVLGSGPVRGPQNVAVAQTTEIPTICQAKVKLQ